ncbi:MAG: hypothetical protein JOZ57_08870 [Abitibacteriaceae bacterium]|nr:hypothetical protein [Abditibacteriaceae bacterium]
MPRFNGSFTGTADGLINLDVSQRESLLFTISVEGAQGFYRWENEGGKIWDESSALSVGDGTYQKRWAPNGSGADVYILLFSFLRADAYTVVVQRQDAAHNVLAEVANFRIASPGHPGDVFDEWTPTVAT